MLILRGVAVLIPPSLRSQFNFSTDAFYCKISYIICNELMKSYEKVMT